MVYVCCFFLNLAHIKMGLYYIFIYNFYMPKLNLNDIKINIL